MHALTLAVQDEVYHQFLTLLEKFSTQQVQVIDDSPKSDYELYLLKHPTISEETYFQAVAMDHSGFAQEVLNSAEEERWNDLL